jgi:hypothetical protein
VAAEIQHHNERNEEHDGQLTPRRIVIEVAPAVGVSGENGTNETISDVY